MSTSTLPILADLSARRLDLVVSRESDPSLSVVIEDEDGVAQDITTDTITWTILDGLGGTVVKAVTKASGSHDDPLNGATTLSLVAADLATASATEETRWWHEIRRVTGGRAIPYWAGTFLVRPTR